MATFTGDDSGNTISGTSSADTIYGRGSDDTLYGRDGDDRVHGESGNDRLFGGYGNDFLYGGIGDDYLKGEWGNDQLFGDDGSDTLYGDIGNDWLFGGAGSDQLFGGTGVDRMEGGTGDDTYHSGEADDELVDSGGIDTLVFYSTQSLTLDATIENLLLRPTSGSLIEARGNSLDNIIRNETSIEARLFGGQGNDSLHGGSAADYLKAESGNDELFGGAGNDTLYGDSGSDRLLGGAGDDELFGGDGFDHMEGGTGNDAYHSSGLAMGSIAGDVIVESDGVDTLFFYSSGVTLPDGVENLTLRSTTDFVSATGNSLDNVIRNEASIEAYLDGAGGDDRVIGGSGFDYFELSSGNDVIDGGAGTDWLAGGSANFRTGIATDGTGTTTFTNIEIAQGGAGDDELVADDAGRTLHGEAGNDTVTGGSGSDSLFGDGGFDHPDTIEGDDVVTGGQGDDFLQGGFGSDTVDGGAGNDILRGSGERVVNPDGTMVADEYADSFVFSSAAGGSNADHIEDFEPGLDELAFENATFTALGGEGDWGTDDSRFYASSGATSGHDADDRLIYDTSAGKLYYDADGLDGGDGLIVATLESAPSLAASDIAVV